MCFWKSWVEWSGGSSVGPKILYVQVVCLRLAVYEETRKVSSELTNGLRLQHQCYTECEVCDSRWILLWFKRNALCYGVLYWVCYTRAGRSDSSLPIWEAIRGGLIIPPQPIATSQLRQITRYLGASIAGTAVHDVEVLGEAAKAFGSVQCFPGCTRYVGLVFETSAFSILVTMII